MSESKQPGDDGPTAETHGAIRAEFDWSDVTPSTAVVETVAIAANQDPMGLEPLYETIDPDALDMLIRSLNTTSTNEEGTVTFAHQGYEVTVHRSGTVVVRPSRERAGGE